MILGGGKTPRVTEIDIRPIADRFMDGMAERGFVRADYGRPEVYLGGRLVRFAAAGTSKLQDGVIRPVSQIQSERGKYWVTPTGVRKRSVLARRWAVDGLVSDETRDHVGAIGNVVKTCGRLSGRRGIMPAVPHCQINVYPPNQSVYPMYGGVHRDEANWAALTFNGLGSLQVSDSVSITRATTHDERLALTESFDNRLMSGSVLEIPTLPGDVVLMAGRYREHRGVCAPGQERTSVVFYPSPIIGLRVQTR